MRSVGRMRSFEYNLDFKYSSKGHGSERCCAEMQCNANTIRWYYSEPAQLQLFDSQFKVLRLCLKPDLTSPRIASSFCMQNQVVKRLVALGRAAATSAGSQLRLLILMTTGRDDLRLRHGFPCATLILGRHVALALRLLLSMMCVLCRCPRGRRRRCSCSCSRHMHFGQTSAFAFTSASASAGRSEHMQKPLIVASIYSVSQTSIICSKMRLVHRMHVVMSMSRMCTWIQ